MRRCCRTRTIDLDSRRRSMDVRLARPTDALLVLSLALDQDAHVVRGPAWPATNPVVRSLARAAFPLAAPGRTWLGRDGCSVALLEAQPRQYVIGWDVTRLVIQGDRSVDLGPLLQAATIHLQGRGVPRLFARCRDDARDALQRLDFNPLAREYILIGPEGEIAGDGPIPLESRYRMRQDDWPLHQLESEITPPLIRHLEGLTSLDWSHPVRAMSEIVVEQDGRVVAWVGWGSKVEAGFLRVGMLLHPRHAQLGPILLQHAHRQVKPGCRLLTRVRDYQVETLRAFTDTGFQAVGEEVLMVKHAGVEAVRTAKPWPHVAALPSIQGFRSATKCRPAATTAVATSMHKEKHS